MNCSWKQHQTLVFFASHQSNTETLMKVNGLRALDFALIIQHHVTSHLILHVQLRIERVLRCRQVQRRTEFMPALVCRFRCDDSIELSGNSLGKWEKCTVMDEAVWQLLSLHRFLKLDYNARASAPHYAWATPTFWQLDTRKWACPTGEGRKKREN